MDNKTDKLIQSLRKISLTSQNVKIFWERASLHMKLSQLKPVGHGDGRVVYAVNDELVVKIAYNSEGKKQNKKELRTYEKFGLTEEGQKWLGEISFGDENWIIMERLGKCSDDDLLGECQMEEWKELYQFLFGNVDVTETPALRMIQWLVDKVKIDRYEIVSRNFGYDKDGQLKMLDYGL